MSKLPHLAQLECLIVDKILPTIWRYQHIVAKWLQVRNVSSFVSLLLVAAIFSTAIAMKPDVLLMDEPCSALDPISSRQVEELCLELKEQYTIIMVTHNMQQAARVADWTAFFNTEIDEHSKRRGKLVEFSPTDQMFNSPQTKEAEDYISGRFG